MLFAAVTVASTIAIASAASNSLNEASPAQLARGILTSPSVTDTTDETLDKGFVYVNFYSGKSCSGSIVAVDGHPTKTCIKTYQDEDSATATGSMMYTCSGGKA
jgi:hypothetical protein